MKYLVYNTITNSIVSFDSLASAEEYILSIAEEEDFAEANYSINAENSVADTLEELMEDLRDWWDQDNHSNECICLYLGAYNYYIRTVPHLED